MLAGCSADSVQVTVGAKDISAALEGEATTVSYVAVFDTFGTLDAEKRSEIEALEVIARRHLQIDEFEIEQDGSSVRVTIEGEMPLVYGSKAAANSKSPWVIAINDVSVHDLRSLFPYSVQLVTSAAFEQFSREAKGISYMASPYAVQPVRFRVRANDGKELRLLAGGFQEGAGTHMIGVVDIPAGGSASLLFSDGAYKQVGGGFWLGK